MARPTGPIDFRSFADEPGSVKPSAFASAAVALLCFGACHSGPCPPDTELQGSLRSGQQLCAYQDSNGTVVRHGPFIEWHANGQKSVEGAYEHGKQTGRWTLWDERGRKIAERDYRDDKLITENKF